MCVWLFEIFKNTNKCLGDIKIKYAFIFCNMAIHKSSNLQNLKCDGYNDQAMCVFFTRNTFEINWIYQQVISYNMFHHQQLFLLSRLTYKFKMLFPKNDCVWNIHASEF